MASQPTFSCVENHRIGWFLEITTFWHSRATTYPRIATICYPQSCNCLPAFLLRNDHESFGARCFIIVKLLIVGGWWLRPLANWSQVMASQPTFSCVENHRIGWFLEITTFWHSRATTYPRIATICYPQSCNCLPAFLLRSDLESFGARCFTVVKLLRLRLRPFPSGRVTCRDTAFKICNIRASSIVQGCPDIPVTTGIVSTGPVCNCET